MIGKRNGPAMRREKLQIVVPAAEPATEGRYMLDEQVGFLLRVAMQRHTSIFMSRMIMCRRAAKFLNCNLELIINERKLL